MELKILSAFQNISGYAIIGIIKANGPKKLMVDTEWLVYTKWINKIYWWELKTRAPA